jgi:hypothetical protein
MRRTWGRLEFPDGWKRCTGGIEWISRELFRCNWESANVTLTTDYIKDIRCRCSGHEPALRRRRRRSSWRQESGWAPPWYLRPALASFGFGKDQNRRTREAKWTKTNAPNIGGVIEAAFEGKNNNSFAIETVNWWPRCYRPVRAHPSKNQSAFTGRGGPKRALLKMELRLTTVVWMRASLSFLATFATMMYIVVVYNYLVIIAP